MRIDISGTVGNEAWEKLDHFREISSAVFSSEEGSSGACEHDKSEPHRAGEWCGAVIEVENHLLAEYAVAHYLVQARVLDAYMDEWWGDG